MLSLITLNEYICDKKSDNFFPYLINPLRLVKAENHAVQHVNLLFVCILFL